MTEQPHPTSGGSLKRSYVRGRKQKIFRVELADFQGLEDAAKRLGTTRVLLLEKIILDDLNRK